MTETPVQSAAALPWRPFTVEVRRLRRLSPSFLRVTFTGPDLDAFADKGFDLRIKLIFPDAGGGFAHLPMEPDWWRRWRELPDEHRNPIRTFTARAVRPYAREVDVDMVVHGDGGGPAAVWARDAAPGDPLMLLGPNAAYQGEHGGVAFRPPAGGCTVLLAGDETAVPAIGAILERLPGDARGEVLLEVPRADDALGLEGPPGVRVRWLARSAGRPSTVRLPPGNFGVGGRSIGGSSADGGQSAGGGHGSRLIPAVQTAAEFLLPCGARRPARPRLELPLALEDVAGDDELLWEVPEETGGGTAPAPAGGPGGLYAWLAGEAGVIKALRRHLVTDRGMDRRSVAFMGYWREGRPEDGV